MCMRKFGWGAAGILAMALSTAAAAKDLNVGLQSVVTSLDPHFYNTSQNNSMSRHVFETLVKLGPNMELQPGLARGWRPVDKTTWEVKLRDGVKWQDGSPFTAEDVVFSFQRAPNVPNSPSSFAAITKEAKQVEAVDATTVRITTEGPSPLLPRHLSLLPIISKKHGERAATEDYNAGKAVIGTGPYKLAEYLPNNRVVLVRNEAYWGDKEPWDKVTFKFLSSGAPRVAALLSGDVDLIDGVPPADIERLSKEQKVELASGPSNRLIYLHLDSNRDKSPFVFDAAGKPLDKNPLKDARVRKAISLAVNRKAIIDSMLDGRGIPASQFMPDGSFGVSRNLRPDPYDPEAAKKLLAEAGYPQGFQLVLHAPNNRYVNDAAVAQVVAQLLTRAGIVTRVETMPAAVYFSRASKLDFSLMLLGWGGADVQETVMVLRSLLQTYSKEKGAGAANRGRYSNPELDKLIDEAMDTLGRDQRAEISARAAELAVKDTALVPLYFEQATWAMKKGVKYQARMDQYTTAMDIR
jgi:peptide/nickel transport system substrate-binding protein